MLSLYALSLKNFLQFNFLQLQKKKLSFSLNFKPLKHKLVFQYIQTYSSLYTAVFSHAKIIVRSKCFWKTMKQQK